MSYRASYRREIIWRNQKEKETIQQDKEVNRLDFSHLILHSLRKLLHGTTHNAMICLQRVLSDERSHRSVPRCALERAAKWMARLCNFAEIMLNFPLRSCFPVVALALLAAVKGEVLRLSLGASRWIELAHLCRVQTHGMSRRTPLLKKITGLDAAERLQLCLQGDFQENEMSYLGCCSLYTVMIWTHTHTNTHTVLLSASSFNWSSDSGMVSYTVCFCFL